MSKFERSKKKAEDAEKHSFLHKAESVAGDAVKGAAKVVVKTAVIGVGTAVAGDIIKDVVQDVTEKKDVIAGTNRSLDGLGDIADIAEAVGTTDVTDATNVAEAAVGTTVETPDI